MFWRRFTVSARLTAIFLSMVLGSVAITVFGLAKMGAMQARLDDTVHTNAKRINGLIAIRVAIGPAR